MSDIQERISKIITELKLTQESFASKLGVSRNTITNILRKKQQPTLEQITKIVTIYHINAKWLLTGNGDYLNKTVKNYEIDNKNPQILEENLIKYNKDELIEKLRLANYQINFLEKLLLKMNK